MSLFIKSYEELTKDELYKILKERINVFVVEQNCPYPEIDGRDIDSYHIFLKDSESILAYVRVLKPGISFEEASIGRVLVNEDNRGLGLGKKIMENAIQFITNELRYNIIRISAQEYLLKFYQELGFKKVSEMYLEDGIPHVEMVFQGNNK
ncbi:GNAT family N-acetyltransferase [Clostridium sp. D2Q-11]|uniref:GNAT family N-acetyltransferase n=1 Tax=Anaeromonas frigoriresistens TaxID=2683708 RepID=A0A942V0S7_9FIRM|nr:GNAT family N-acetyltransferase [Anaeromonas frigoriresistens]MBS4539082.1 GNAT family N-acetyltransferase [Anaeromonas frigoriresistens]